MPSQQRTARDLESVDWEDVQETVRAFRRALDRGERPALEAYVPEARGNRRAALIELIHEEMEVCITAGESFAARGVSRSIRRSAGRPGRAPRTVRGRVGLAPARDDCGRSGCRPAPWSIPAVWRGRRFGSAATSWGT